MSTATIAQVAAVVDRASTDSSFRQQLVSSPAATLASAGVAVDAGTTVQVLENTTTLHYMIVPARPSGVPDSELQATGPAPSGSTSDVAQNLVAFGNLVIATWTDSALRSQLIQNPASVLAQRGISVPAGVSIKAIDGAANVAYLILPPMSGGQS